MASLVNGGVRIRFDAADGVVLHSLRQAEPFCEAAKVEMAIVMVLMLVVVVARMVVLICGSPDLLWAFRSFHAT